MPVRSDGDDAFLDARRKPRLTRCAVLLGARAMNQGPPEEVQQRLEDLDRAVTGTFRDILGLSLGLFHVREGLIFGPALVEAYELEDLHAVHPRVVLSKEAEAVIPRPSSQLLCDGDGWTFINYLDPLLEEPDDPVAVLQAHRDRVLAGLSLNRDRKRVWEKHRWVAEYHNAFVDRAVLEGRLGAAEDVGIPAVSMAWRFAPFD